MVNGEYCWGNGVGKEHESWIDDGFRVSVKRVLWKKMETVNSLEWANFFEIKQEINELCWSGISIIGAGKVDKLETLEFL